MYLRLFYTCFCLSVCMSVIYGLRPSRRNERQKSHAAAATAGFNTPVHPVPSSQCLVNGIFLFDGAVWSPDACTMCQCRDGEAQCQEVPCLNIALPSSRLQGGLQKPSRGVKPEKTSGQKKVLSHNGKRKASQGKEIVEVKLKTAPRRDKIINV